MDCFFIYYIEIKLCFRVVVGKWKIWTLHALYALQQERRVNLHCLFNISMSSFCCGKMSCWTVCTLQLNRVRILLFNVCKIFKLFSFFVTTRFRMLTLSFCKITRKLICVHDGHAAMRLNCFLWFNCFLNKNLRKYKI